MRIGCRVGKPTLPANNCSSNIFNLPWRRIPVRMIVATLEDPREQTIEGAGALRKIFTVHTDMVGRVVEYDGDRFAIEFHPR